MFQPNLSSINTQPHGSTSMREKIRKKKNVIAHSNKYEYEHS